MRARLLILTLVAVGLPTMAEATIVTPEYLLSPYGPPPTLRAGEPYTLPVSLFVREDRVFVDLRPVVDQPGVDQPGADKSGADLKVVEVATKAGRPMPEGYQRYDFEISGICAPGTAPELVLHLFDSETRLTLDLGTTGAAPRRMAEQPRRHDAESFARPRPTASVRTAAKSAAAARTVTVTGRLVMEMPPEVEGGEARIEGVDGATVKVMQPVFFLDDNTLGEDVTDVNGDFAFDFSLDGTQDIYVKVEAANGTTVNVGTGDFFSTYNEQIRFDDFAGTSIDLGTLSWTGNFNMALFTTTVITRAHREMGDLGFVPDRVHVRFPDDYRSTAWYNPVGGLEGIHLRNDNAFNCGTMLHEYGHHFVHQFADQVSPPGYCNGVCDPGTPFECGHCYWCAETQDTAWSEGFPNFLSWYLGDRHPAVYTWELPNRRSTETLRLCDRVGGASTPRLTEGYVAALLQDLVDADNEDDPLVDPIAEDRTTFGIDLILDVATTRGPSNSVDFVRECAAELAERPGYTDLDLANFWSTVRNNGLADDDVPPSAPVTLGSSTHQVNVASANAQPIVTIGGATDDFTGVHGMFVTMTNAPRRPEAMGEVLVGTTALWPNPLTAGNWYANARSMDGAGNLSDGWVSYGPIVIDSPQPVDLVAAADLLWEAPLIVRNTPDGIPGAVGWPATLSPGDAWANVLIRNDSAGSGTVDSVTVRIDLAGETVASRRISVGTMLPGGLVAANNIGPFFLPPGRHLVSAFIDADNDLAELVESNNSTGVEVRSVPTTLTYGTWVDLPYAGNTSAGGIDVGFPVYNQVGGRLNLTSEYTLVAIRPDRLSEASNLSAYATESGVLSGFESPVGGVAYDTALGMAFLVLDRSQWTGSTGSAVVDLGAGSSAGAEMARIRMRAMVPEATLNVPPSGELVHNFTIPATDEDRTVPLLVNVGSGLIGFLEVSVDATFDGANSRKSLHAHWFTGDAASVALDGRAPDAATLRGATARFYPFAASGQYLLVLSDSGQYPTGPVEITGQLRITFERRPELHLPEEDPIWDVGLLPTPFQAQDDTLRFPTELLGDVAGTFVNFSLVNTSNFSSGNVTANVEFGGQPYQQLDLGGVPRYGRIEYRSPTPLNIPPGRHTLSVVIDPANQIDEPDEANNVFALQYGWTGATVYPGQPILRPAPPLPDPRHGVIRQLQRVVAGPDGESGPFVQMSFKAPECDGWRLDTGVNKRAHDKNASGYWVGAAALPEAGGIGLNLHDADVPPIAAYVNALASSNWDEGLSQYVLAFVPSGSPVFDVGVVNTGSSSQYVAQTAAGLPLGQPVPGQWYGPYALPPGEILDLYEVDLAPGSYDIALQNLAQTAALGVSVHPPYDAGHEPWHSKDDLLVGTPNGWQNGAGANQLAHVEVPVGGDGRWCVAVWKQGSADRDVAVNYQLQIEGFASTPPPVTVDGTLDAMNYGPALVIQTLETAFGDNNDPDVAAANGSELDGAFGLIQDGWLYLLLTGNLESIGYDLEIFFDTRPGGQNRLRGDNSTIADDALGQMGDDGSGNGLAFDAGFAADWYLTVGGRFSGPTFDSEPYLLEVALAELPDLGGGAGWHLGAAYAADTGLLYGPEPDTENPWGVRAAIRNDNTAGVTLGTGASDGASATTGIEFAIPLAALGSPQGCIRICAFVNGQVHDFVSNQVLGPLPVGTDYLGPPREVDFSTFAGEQNFAICPAGMSAVGDERPDLPGSRMVLHRPAPNPFNPRTTVEFSLARTSEVDLAVYDAAGRLVRRLIAGEMRLAGRHAVTWTGDDGSGRRVASGVYFFRLRDEVADQVQRVVLLK